MTITEMTELGQGGSLSWSAAAFVSDCLAVSIPAGAAYVTIQIVSTGSYSLKQTADSLSSIRSDSAFWFSVLPGLLDGSRQASLTGPATAVRVDMVSGTAQVTIRAQSEIPRDVSTWLISWDDYKAVYGISDNDEQSRYQRLINLASARIETHCQRRLRARDYLGDSALVVPGSGTATLVCPEYPLNSVSSITIDGTDVTSEIYFHQSSGVITLTSGRVFPDDSASNAGSITIECNAGYTETAIEWPTLQTAAFVFVRWMAQRFAGGIGKKSETSADGMSVSFEIDIPLEVRTMLDPFMRRGHA